MNTFSVFANTFEGRNLSRFIYRMADRTYRTMYPSRGLVTPPPENDNPLEAHLRDLWDDRYISGSRFDEAYKPVTLAYRMYQIYGIKAAMDVMKGEVK